MSFARKWAAVATLGFAVRVMAQGPIQPGNAPGQDVLVLNASPTANGVACLQQSLPAHVQPLRCPFPESYPNRFLRQGRRTELEVFNRKFLTDYSITIDAVTQIQTGPNIRNLNEAENLTLNPISLVPPSKGGVEGLTARTADKILFDLIDETRATQPETDLRSDRAVIQRERAKLIAQIEAFDESYDLLLTPLANNLVVQCGNVAQPPNSTDVTSVRTCLDAELGSNSINQWAGPGPFSDEPGFRDVNTRVQDLVAAVNTLGTNLTNSNLPQKRAELEAGISQYENDLNIFRGNIKAAQDASRLAAAMTDGDFRKTLRREQMKVLLMDKLKQGTPKPIDDAELNALLDDYENFYRRSLLSRSSGPESVVPDRLPDNRWLQLRDVADRYLAEIRPPSEFAGTRKRISDAMDVDLPNAIAELNVAQTRLLNRVNYIYDHSEVIEPLVKQIDLSGHSGNLVVYYTIRRIENFQRYTIAQVQGPGSGTPAMGQGTPLLPPAVQAAAAPATASGGATAANTTTSSSSSTTTTTASATVSPAPASANTTQGTVVAKGSFEVHEFFQANVVAAVTFSTLKDQSVTSQAQLQACKATSSTPDPNCFSPLVSGSYKWTPIVGLDWYWHARDSSRNGMGACRYDWKQCVGIMGAASVTKANNYFLGGFFEPVLGVQVAAGANLGTKTVLQPPYKANIPVDISGAFPTASQRGTGFFASVGLDLGIFRKVFGKFTGIGTSTSGTSGQ